MYFETSRGEDLKSRSNGALRIAPVRRLGLFPARGPALACPPWPRAPLPRPSRRPWPPKYSTPTCLTCRSSYDARPPPCAPHAVHAGGSPQSMSQVENALDDTSARSAPGYDAQGLGVPFMRHGKRHSCYDVPAHMRPPLHTSGIFHHQATR